MNKKYYIFTPSAAVINVYPIVIIVLELLIFGRVKLDITFISTHLMLSLVILFGYFILHEFLHAFSYIIHGANPKKVVFGACLEKGIFYCLCKQNISRKNILISSMYPFIFLGVIALIIALIFDNAFLFLLAIFNISGCAADVATFIFISKLKDVEFSEMDDELKFAIYSDKDISKVKSIGIKYVECKDSIERKKFKKLTISKYSYIILLIFMVLIVLETIL